MTQSPQLPRYDRTRSYEWNYAHAPDPLERDVPALRGRWTFCGLPVGSPLGMPAGPLLNGRWILFYARLGFDVLTYKTVRSVARQCYPLPNLLPVRCGQLHGGESELPAMEQMDGSWAVSFGMPSQAPDAWRADIEWTRNRLPAEQVLSVSVVGSMEEDWTLDDLAEDYARCARWAVDSGADAIETNFSCPNVSTCDGQLYQEPKSAAVVAARVRESIGHTPYLVKIGHVADEEQATRLLEAIAPLIDGLAMTNSVAATVVSVQRERQFGGEPRGICGDATRTASLRQAGRFSQQIEQRGDKLDLVGVGGVSSAGHVRDYLAAGVRSVHIATAAMTDPLVGIRIREELAGEKGLSQ